MSIWSAHCALGRPSWSHRGRGCQGPFGGSPGHGGDHAGHARGCRRPEARGDGHDPTSARAPAGAVRWERPHDQERRRRRSIGGS
ncbi:hypothetical protein [Thermomonospora umbrina]|uniref:hypothetical protein n=1 Tax=Thermomonospora umbrina TaxID=111806 RepID=UPI0011C11EB3|nr:hypothetical protein [Thermomonospora umbrina]